MPRSDARIAVLAALTAIVGICAVGVAAAAEGSQAHEPARRAELLVLGTYHMANPGRDTFNLEVDDVLAPRRQREIAELLDVLRRFAPTKIAVEQESHEKLDARYAAYLAGEYVLTANEIDQIGLRLAKELGHAAVYAVDADGDFPYPRLVKFAQATGQTEAFDAIQAGFGALVKRQGERLKSQTVLEAMRYLNSDARVEEEMGLYLRLARFGEPYDDAGPDLLAEWFRRNARIHGNVVRLATTPDERLLVVFGSGHLGWLRQLAASDHTFRLRKLEELLPADNSRGRLGDGRGGARKR